MSDPTDTSLINPVHPVAPEVAEALAALREESQAAADRRHQLAASARPSKKERKAIAELAGVKSQKGALREIGNEWAERIEKENIETRSELFDLTPIDLQPPARDAADPNFWWARTDWTTPNFYKATFRPDGLVFTGKFTYDSDPLFGFSFGATSAFEINSERLPTSPSGRWRSSPHIELFGGLRGWTGPGGLFTSDAWCKVWIVRRQTVFQWGFGPTGPAFIKRGEAIEVRQAINEENAHRDYLHRLPGFQPMPSVEFGGIFPGSVWSHLEVRFDVQLEGNSFLWLEPEVLVRGFQWPAIAI